MLTLIPLICRMDLHRAIPCKGYKYGLSLTYKPKLLHNCLET